MKKINAEDWVVSTDPASPRRGEKWRQEIWWAVGPSVCLAPTENYPFKIGDWVLPVLCDPGFDSWLLKPFKIAKLSHASYITPQGDDPPLWFARQLVPIKREENNVIIGNSCELGICEYLDRYDMNAEDLPENSNPRVSQEIKNSSGIWAKNALNIEANYGFSDTDTGAPKFPTSKDVEDCCGIWSAPEDNYYIKVYKFDREMHDDLDTSLDQFEDRLHFDRYFEGSTRIEPAPPEPTKVPKWTDDAVLRYPRQSEWD